MENKLSKLKTVQKFTLSEGERGMLRAKLARYVTETPVEEAQSMLQRGIYHGLRIALSSFMFLILIGGSVSAVANRSLPGDPLYAVKVDVNEEIKARLMDSPEERLAWQQKRIQNRVDEIKILTQSQTLTKEKQAVVQKALSDHTITLASELSTASPETALKVTAELEASLQADKTVIETALLGDTAPTTGTMMMKTDAALFSTGPTVDTSVLDAVDATIAKVSEEQDKILQKELDKIDQEFEKDDVIDNVSEALEGSTTTETSTFKSSVTPSVP